MNEYSFRFEQINIKELQSTSEKIFYENHRFNETGCQ